jgi:hypothetical protein
MRDWLGLLGVNRCHAIARAITSEVPCDPSGERLTRPGVPSTSIGTRKRRRWRASVGAWRHEGRREGRRLGEEGERERDEQRDEERALQGQARVEPVGAPGGRRRLRGVGVWRMVNQGVDLLLGYGDSAKLVGRHALGKSAGGRASGPPSANRRDTWGFFLGRGGVSCCSCPGFLSCALGWTCCQDAHLGNRTGRAQIGRRK